LASFGIYAAIQEAAGGEEFRVQQGSAGGTSH
jgi:hypothetical protein